MTNSNNQLKPEMFARGVLEAGVQSNESLTVPKSAVMWTGTRSVVYVKNATDMGTSFLMKEVILGAALGDRFVVKEGLEAGQEIAVSGTFSIDAAAQLAGKPSMMSPEGGAAMTGHNHGNLSNGQGEISAGGTKEMEKKSTLKYPEINVSEETFEVNDTFKNQIKQVYLDYLPVKDAMIASAPAVANTKSEILLKAIAKVDMSQAKGAFWLSDSDKVLNPYFGDAMLTCGNVEEELN
jgi:membrane fusion protein, copper/silver efflux system